MKPLIIVGPTSSGKSALSLRIAHSLPATLRQNGVDIVVIDSKQVYRDQDIVPGKDLQQDSENIRSLGVNLVSPDEEWSVAASVAYVQSAISAAGRAGRFLIIVGGTPQYVLAVFDQPASLSVAPDREMRATLESETIPLLQHKLQSLDSEKLFRMNNSDRNNPRRLIRAIEVASKGRTIEKNVPFLLISDCVWFGLKLEKEELEARIAKRVEQRLAAGAIREYDYLLSTYPAWTKEAKAAIGYSEIAAFKAGELTKNELRDLWILHELQYAKRQMTWWKRERQIEWFAATSPDLHQRVSQAVNTCYNVT